MEEDLKQKMRYVLHFVKNTVFVLVVFFITPITLFHNLITEVSLFGILVVYIPVCIVAMPIIAYYHSKSLNHRGVHMGSPINWAIMCIFFPVGGFIYYLTEKDVGHRGEVHEL